MKDHPHFWAYAALVSVCIFWGTTYAAIRMALETLPPLSIVAFRYILSGGLMLAACKLFKIPLPRGRELLLTALYGVIILGVGNGALVLAEQWVPSGLAALMITVSPFWFLGFNALLPPREPVSLPTLAGLFVGLAGVALLIGPDAFKASATLQGFIVLQIGCAGWTLGSVLQKRQNVKTHPIVGGAVQQLAAGLAFLPLALTLETLPAAPSARSLSAVLYLILFGSVVGYSSYVFALQRLPLPVVSIYNYVNPVVAVILGVLIFSEPFAPRQAAAMAVIFLGVAVVKRFEAVRPASPPKPPTA